MSSVMTSSYCKSSGRHLLLLRPRSLLALRLYAVPASHLSAHGWPLVAALLPATRHAQAGAAPRARVRNLLARLPAAAAAADAQSVVPLCGLAAAALRHVLLPRPRQLGLPRLYRARRVGPPLAPCQRAHHPRRPGRQLWRGRPHGPPLRKPDRARALAARRVARAHHARAQGEPR